MTQSHQGHVDMVSALQYHIAVIRLLYHAFIFSISCGLAARNIETPIPGINSACGLGYGPLCPCHSILPSSTSQPPLIAHEIVDRNSRAQLSLLLPIIQRPPHPARDRKLLAISRRILAGLEALGLFIQKKDISMRSAERRWCGRDEVGDKGSGRLEDT